MAVFNCLASSGAIMYSPGGDYGGGGGGGDYRPGEGGGGGSERCDGVGGGGFLWSGYGQLIWISINNAPKYPLWLKPGWNVVHFWIPFIFPDDEWVEAFIIIEAPGYILIPAGFEFSIKTDKNAPVGPGNSKMVDKLKFVDVYDYELQSAPAPIDLDGLIEDLVFEDTHSIDIVAISNVVDESCIENLAIEDINDYDIRSAPVTIDLDCLMEELVFEDINDYEIQVPFSGEAEQIEDISFTDINATSEINATVSNQLESENIGFDDFVEIEKT